MYGSLCMAQTYLSNDSCKLKEIQSKFLWSLFGVPRCVPNALLRLLAVLVPLKVCTWFQDISFWLKLYLSPWINFINCLRQFSLKVDESSGGQISTIWFLLCNLTASWVSKSQNINQRLWAPSFKSTDHGLTLFWQLGTVTKILFHQITFIH